MMIIIKYNNINIFLSLTMYTKYPKKIVINITYNKNFFKFKYLFLYNRYLL
jgi:hypothetical protein